MSYAAVIGAGPAGLMAAEALAEADIDVHVFDAMPSFGRKFLLAGRGGLNLTHSEPFEKFLDKFGAARPALEPFLRNFTPDDLRAWTQSMGIETFVGSSGRVFPKALKASPLLRAWLRRLGERGVTFHARHRWEGWRGDRLLFSTPESEREISADVVILALGGASWPRLGSDAAWVPLLREHNVSVNNLQPANCGFDIRWSAAFVDRHAGAPVKPATISFDGETKRGEFIVTRDGVEGGLIYALAEKLRTHIAQHGSATIFVDLAPDRSFENILAALQKPRGTRSMSTHLARAGFSGVKAGLLRECLRQNDFTDLKELAKGIKALPINLVRPRPIAEAISSAGGVAFEALDEKLMLKNMPGIFCAGEMLDWEAPTGGYLLNACLATGLAAGRGAKDWLKR